MFWLVAYLALGLVNTVFTGVFLFREELSQAPTSDEVANMVITVLALSFFLWPVFFVFYSVMFAVQVANAFLGK